MLNRVCAYLFIPVQVAPLLSPDDLVTPASSVCHTGLVFTPPKLSNSVPRHSPSPRQRIGTMPTELRLKRQLGCIWCKF